jgi:hypothetical protein
MDLNKIVNEYIREAPVEVTARVIGNLEPYPEAREVERRTISIMGHVPIPVRKPKRRR